MAVVQVVLAASSWLRLLMHAFIRAVMRERTMFGMGIAASSAMSTTTIIISTIVNPRFFDKIIFMLAAKVVRLRQRRASTGPRLQSTALKHNGDTILSRSAGMEAPIIPDIALGTPPEGFFASIRSRRDAPAGHFKTSLSHGHQTEKSACLAFSQ